MMETYYREQAAICAEQRAASVLPNVRDRRRRSEQAWLEMAEKASRFTRLKAGRN
jgi:hypothetical protein